MMRKSLIYVCIFFLTFSSLCGQTILRGKIVDQATGAPIPNAKLGVSSQGVGVLTDETGSFVYHKHDQVLDTDSKLYVRAKGYQRFELTIDQIRSIYDTLTTLPLIKSDKPMPVPAGVITIYWDASEGMAGRDLEKELLFIEKQLSLYNIKKVNLVIFNDKIRSQETVDIGAGDIARFRESVKNLDYTGPADYGLIRTAGASQIWLFSNGNKTFGHIDVMQNIPITIISSHSRHRNEKLLQAIASYTSGKFVTLDTIGSIKGSREESTTTIGEDSAGLKGRVTSLEKPIQGASILIKGSLTEVVTDVDGLFTIDAIEGDILQISYLGMYTKELLVQNNKKLQVELIPKNDVLDEVILVGQKEQFVVNNKIKKGTRVEGAPGGVTGRGYFYITEKDIVPDGNTVEQVMQKLFKGVRVSTSPYGDPIFTIRGKRYSFYINGAKWQVPSTLPFHIPDNEIASIVVKDDGSYATLFGIPEPGRMVIITTKNNSEAQRSVSASSEKKYSDYLEENIAALSTTNQDPIYIKQLKSYNKASDRLDAYRKLSQTKELSLEFYSDVVRYFQKTTPVNADIVRGDLAYIARNNTKALRMLAYLYEEANDKRKTLATYERILAIAPKEAQSYRDVANAYVENEQYNKALELYINMVGNRVKGVNFTGLQSLLNTELLRLANLYKDKIEFDRLRNSWFKIDFKQDVRMVIEYSDPTAPFEFQFVNPDKKFHKWNHTLEENRERLEDEKRQGFQAEEFIIDDAPKGEWLVNVQYLGEEGDYIVPPFLKYTIYRNYGMPSETKEMGVIKLFKQQEKVTLSKITI